MHNMLHAYSNDDHGVGLFLRTFRGSAAMMHVRGLSARGKIGLGAATQSQGQPINGAIYREATEMPRWEHTTISPIRADGEVWLRRRRAGWLYV